MKCAQVFPFGDKIGVFVVVVFHSDVHLHIRGTCPWPQYGGRSPSIVGDKKLVGEHILSQRLGLEVEKLFTCSTLLSMKF